MNNSEYALVWVSNTTSTLKTPYLLYGEDLNKFFKKDPSSLHDFDAAAGCLCAINEQNEESLLNPEELKILFVRLTERLFEKGTELEGFTYEEAFAVDVCDEIREVVGIEAALKCGLGAIAIFPTQVLINNTICDYLRYVNSTISPDKNLCAKGVLLFREILNSYEISEFEKENHFIIAQAYATIFNDFPEKLAHLIQNKLGSLNLSEEEKSALRSQVNRQLNGNLKILELDIGQNNRRPTDENEEFRQIEMSIDESDRELTGREKDQKDESLEQDLKSSYSHYKPRTITNTFGLTPDNPIYTKGPLGSENYLKLLATPNKLRIQYSRVGIVEHEKFPMPVDEYKISDSEGFQIYSIYLYMYSAKQSEIAPQGLLYLPISKILTEQSENVFAEKEIRITPSGDPEAKYYNDEKMKRSNTKTIIISIAVGYLIFKILSKL